MTKELEKIAKAVHNAWWNEKIKQGATKHPDMIPYEDLTENVKEYDRVTDRAVLEVLPELQGWLPVSERLPKEACKCLVTTENLTVLPYHVCYDNHSWCDADGNEIPVDVIAWWPVPEPYQPEY